MCTNIHRIIIEIRWTNDSSFQHFWKDFTDQDIVDLIYIHICTSFRDHPECMQNLLLFQSHFHFDQSVNRGHIDQTVYVRGICLANPVNTQPCLMFHGKIDSLLQQD